MSLTEPMIMPVYGSAVEIVAAAVLDETLCIYVICSVGFNIAKK